MNVNMNVNVNLNVNVTNNNGKKDCNPLNFLLAKQQTISSAGATSHSTKGKLFCILLFSET